MHYFIAQQMAKKLSDGSPVSSNAKTQDLDDGTLFHYSDDFVAENEGLVNHALNLSKMHPQHNEEQDRNWDVLGEHRGRNLQLEFDEITEKSNESQFSEQESYKDGRFGHKKIPFIFEEDLPANLNFLFQPHFQSNFSQNNLNSVVVLDNLSSVANFRAKKDITGQLNWCMRSVSVAKNMVIQSKPMTSDDLRDFKLESKQRVDVFRGLLGKSCLVKNRKNNSG